MADVFENVTSKNILERDFFRNFFQIEISSSVVVHHQLVELSLKIFERMSSTENKNEKTNASTQTQEKHSNKKIIVCKYAQKSGRRK